LAFFFIASMVSFLKLYTLQMKKKQKKLK